MHSNYTSLYTNTCSLSKYGYWTRTDMGIGPIIIMHSNYTSLYTNSLSKYEYWTRTDMGMGPIIIAIIQLCTPIADEQV